MIFPSSFPEYFDEQDRYVLKRMENFYNQSLSLNQAWWSEADIDSRVEAGDISVFGDVFGMALPFKKHQFFFNHVRTTVEMPVGYQRRNRKSTICTPRENGNQQTADQFTKLLMSINEQEGILETLSDAFRGALVTGMNLLHVWIDYRNDPISGDIKVDKCSYNEFLIDPFFRKPDLSDCNGIWRRKFITRFEAMSLFPERQEEIMSLRTSGEKDFKFQYMPETVGLGSANTYMRDELTYDEFSYRDYRKQKMLVDVKTGETMEWRSSDEDALKLFLQLHPEVTVLDQEIPTVRQAIVIQGRVFYDGPNLSGLDTYSYVPILGYYRPELQYMSLRCMGMVRSLRDAQFLYTRFLINSADLFESVPNTGFIYKPDSLINPLDVYTQNGFGKGIAVKPEANLDDIRPIIPPQVPPSMSQLSETFSREIQRISGVNEELLGSATENDVGVLSMLRQSAGLTTLQSLFDQLDFSQKMLGRLMLSMIQTNYTPGKIQRIIQEQPSDQFYSKVFGKYDCVIEEGLNTSTQKQLQFVQLLKLREAGVNIPDDVLLDAATVQNKQQLVDAVARNAQQQQQLQQAQAQVAMQEQQAKIQLAQARAQADAGLGIERMSRVQENQALAEERKAAAEKDEEAALLDRVKVYKELESIDLGHLRELITMANMLKGQVISPEPPQGMNNEQEEIRTQRAQAQEEV